MHNDRLQDELLALESIYPESVNWQQRQDGSVTVKLMLKVDLEERQEVSVWDWIEPQSSPSANLENVAAPIASKSSTGSETEHRGHVGRTGSRNGRRRGGKATSERGGGSTSQRNRQPLAPTAQPFSPPVPHTTTSTTSEVQGSAPATRPMASPPVLSNSKTPRISFTPRTRSPSSPPASPDTKGSPSVLKPTMSEPRRLSLRYLPPLHLSIDLPLEYPESSGPTSIDLAVEENWLEEDKKAAAIEKLKEVYVGEECLFGIAELLSSASPDFFPTLSLKLPLELRQSQSFTGSTPLSDVLVKFDRQASSSAFETTSHLCPLCFSPRKGSTCIQLDSCGCVFCTPCLRDYFSLLITEGLVRSVACPDIGCVDKRSKWEKANGASAQSLEKDMERPGRVSSEEVEKLCGSEARKRFEWLNEKIRVESDLTISYCPRESCQAPTPKLDDEDKLRICPACTYSFCVYCRKTYHGNLSACALPQQSAIVTRYLAADPDGQRTIEAQYGAANIKRLVAAYEEERQLQEWLAEHATRCPSCNVPVEKSHGCNHMTCGKCLTHFCYRCGKSISPRDPYKHFNTEGSRCYGKLFEFSPGGEPGIEEWIGDLLIEDGEGGH